ncbi:leukemia inhibitory factor receptor [Nothobranchius furzeri]|uniref:Leukemia inhibitory factor receptor-like n=2 Tax=Nothobranchius TaxID=28779 RepID=A0A9D2XE89_NOTFU|nr:leukemia inhibitory factor receptor-like [Nothobranchius furzeri]
MRTGRFRTRLLWLCLVFSRGQSECRSPDGSLPLTPSISHLEAFSDEQSLVVSWLGSRGASESDGTELQISRADRDNIVYSGSVSVSAGASGEYKWTWFSDLPLECTDHSVRIRTLCNQTSSSSWSSWKTNYGVEAKTATQVFPNREFLKEGDTVMFCCVPKEGVNITRITFGVHQYPLLSVGARVKAVSVKHLTIPTTLVKAWSLTCSDSTGEKVHSMKFISFPPQKPRNITCATSDMKTVNCSWDSGRKRAPSDRNTQTYVLHIENSHQAPIKCKSSLCSFPAVPRLQEYRIRVVVKDQLGEEMEIYNFNISDRVLPVLAWDRVNPGVTDVSLSWSVQGNLTQTGLLCQAEILSDSTRELICKSVSGLCRTKLEHLHPSTRYSARARCSVSGRLWGGWTQPVVFSTDSLVTLDLWRRIQHLSNSNGRQVSLSWSPHIFGKASEVTIQSYNLTWSQDGQVSTELKDGGQNQAEVFVGSGRCDISVQAEPSTGFSLPATITIPPNGDTGIVPLKRRVGGNAAGEFYLSWNEQSSVTCGYTVEWCILGNTAPCTVQWKKAPEGNSTLFLPASHFTAGCRYTFNVYGCSENGHTLLEIQTGYSQELSHVQSPSLIKPVYITSSSVTLEWRYDEDDPVQPAFITGYLVTLQETGSDAQTGQAANLFNVSVGDPRQRSVTIEGLQQQQEYTCSVSALTKEGPGHPASITVRTRTNYLSHSVKILTPILLLLGCAILLWPQRKMLKNILKEVYTYPVGMNIKTPEFDSFLREMDQKLQAQKVEECMSCEIEILNNKPEMTKLKVPDLTDFLRCPDSQSSPPSRSCLPVETEYRPQVAMMVSDCPTQQQATDIRDRSCLSTMAEHHSEHHEVTLGQTSLEPSDLQQESCVIIYGYISKT